MRVYCILIIGLLFTAAIVHDLRSKRIPNIIILMGLSVSFFYQTFSKEGMGIWEYFGGGGLAIILLYGLFIFRMIGAGDIKMLAVTGGFFGIRESLYCIAGAFAIGAIFSIYKIYKYKNLYERLEYLKIYISNFIRTKKFEPYYDMSNEASIIHFTIPISISFLLCCAIRFTY